MASPVVVSPPLAPAVAVASPVVVSPPLTPKVA
jgi:hypothetical protein